MLLYDWGAGLALLASLLMLSGLYFWLFNPEKHVHDGYVIADVLVTTDATGDDGFMLVVHTRLPDGSDYTLRTKSLALASEVRQQVCLERRRTESGTSRYVITQWQNCRRAAVE